MNKISIRIDIYVRNDIPELRNRDGDRGFPEFLARQLCLENKHAATSWLLAVILCLEITSWSGHVECTVKSHD